MTQRDLLLSWATLGFELVLFVLVYIRGVRRRLPFFTGYVTLLVIGMLAMQTIYLLFGFQSAAYYYADWFTIGVDLLARTLAIVELCRYGLRAYQGVWALAWRILIALAVFLLAHGAVDAWGQPNRIAIYGLTIERDVDILAIGLLIVLLAIRNYYGLSLDPLQTRIAGGILLLCVVDIANNTVVRDLFAGNLFTWFSTGHSALWASMRPQVEQVNEWWNTIRFSAFMISMSIWCYALRKPLPTPAREPVLLPAQVYEELSPAVNLRLRSFNDRLQEMLKP
jgi:hypothetical protein